jgi:uncharacterized ferritin-like protein (DUF455 family)
VSYRQVFQLAYVNKALVVNGIDANPVFFLAASLDNVGDVRKLVVLDLIKKFR